MAKFDLKKISSMAKDIVDKSGDKIASGVNTATDKIDEKTKGKYHDKLEKVDSAAQKLDKTGKAKADADGGHEGGAEAAADGPVGAAPEAPAGEGQPTAASDAPDDGQPTSFPEPT